MHSLQIPAQALCIPGWFPAHAGSSYCRGQSRWAFFFRGSSPALRFLLDSSYLALVGGTGGRNSGFRRGIDATIITKVFSTVCPHPD